MRAGKFEVSTPFRMEITSFTAVRAWTADVFVPETIEGILLACACQETGSSLPAKRGAFEAGEEKVPQSYATNVLLPERSRNVALVNEGTRTCTPPIQGCGGPASPAALPTRCRSTTSAPRKREQCTISCTTEKREKLLFLHCLDAPTPLSA